MADQLPAKPTEMQKLFETYVSDGMRPLDAAKKAGYKNPRTEGWRLMQIPHVVQGIQKSTSARFAALSGKALSTLDALMGENYSPSVRLGAAKAIVERDYAHQKDNKSNDLAGKSLADMTEDELISVAKRARERRLAMEADEADKADANAGAGSQVIDITPEGATSAT